MSTRMYEDLKDTLKEELRAIAKKGELSKESLDTMYKLTKTMTSIDKMMEMEGGNSNERGYSMNYARNSYEGSYNQGSYGQGSYNQGNYNQGSNRGSYDGNNNRGSYEGGSNRGSYDGNYNSNRGSYEGSYGRRGRDADSDGRYSEYGNSRDYSRHTSKERMIQNLEMMMNEAGSEKEREAIKRCMEQLEY